MKERTKCIDVKRWTPRHKGIVSLADFPSRLAKVIHPASRFVIDEHIAHQDAILVCEVRKPPVELCNVLANGNLKRLFQRKILHRRPLRLVSGLRFNRLRLSIHLAARLNPIDRRNNVVCRVGIFAGRFRISDLNIFSILRRFKPRRSNVFYRCVEGGIFTLRLTSAELTASSSLAPVASLPASLVQRAGGTKARLRQGLRAADG